MNKRIKLLAEQAGFGLRRDGEIYTSRLEHLPITEDLAKFAELIVRQCVQVCADRGKHHDGLYSVWADDCSKRIGKHFGVEE